MFLYLKTTVIFFVIIDEKTKAVTVDRQVIYIVSCFGSSHSPNNQEHFYFYSYMTRALHLKFYGSLKCCCKSIGSQKIKLTLLS